MSVCNSQFTDGGTIRFDMISAHINEQSSISSNLALFITQQQQQQQRSSLISPFPCKMASWQRARVNESKTERAKYV
jgi:hypothetical protein